jgi:alkyl sulfatase BDS1-like metallo-beta-lactamase superfamily hydrolase
VIFTHTHTDHWGGARGVLDDDMLASGNVPIIAPNLFMEHAVSENIIAGPAMLRRAQYQFGPFLAKGPRAQVDCGLGKSMAAGSVALLRPTDLIMMTGDKRTIDGLEFEFQMAPNSEAPAEMHFFIPRYKLLNLAENCTHNFHNCFRSVAPTCAMRSPGRNIWARRCRYGAARLMRCAVSTIGRSGALSASIR